MAALAVVTNLTIGTVTATTFEIPEAAMVVVDVGDVVVTETITEGVVTNTMVLLPHDHRLVGNRLRQVVRALGEVHRLRCLLTDGNLPVSSEVKWDISNSLHLRQIITTSPITSPINRMGEAGAAINID